MNVRHFLYLILLLLGAACQGTTVPATQAKPKQPRSDLPTDIVAERVTVQADTNHAFSVYLPKSYSHAKAHGVVYFFDPQGNGSLPVKKYSALADTHGFVLVGSLNSRNGQHPGESSNIFRLLQQDCREKFNLDSNLVFLAGFSGGARVAANLAQQDPRIVAVAGCGAGFSPRSQDQFAYMGIVGMEDFNFQEMRQLDETLDGGPIHHVVEYFPGGHKWPPVDYMAKAFQFFLLRAMAAGKLEKNITLTQAVLADYRAKDSLAAVLRRDYDRWSLQRKTIAYLKGLEDVSAMEALKSKLDSAAGVVAEKARIKEEFLREINLRDTYTVMLQTAPAEEWTMIGSMLNKMGRHGNAQEAWKYKRMLGYLSLNCYMLANNALVSGDVANANRYVSIYQSVDPENPEHAYMTAILAIRRNDLPSTFAALEQSFELGNRDWKRLNADSNFFGMHSQATFQDLIKRMQTTPAKDED